VFYDPGTGDFHYATDDDDTLFDLFSDLRRQYIAAGMGDVVAGDIHHRRRRQVQYRLRLRRHL
jgi:hypothetical protein